MYTMEDFSAKLIDGSIVELIGLGGNNYMYIKTDSQGSFNTVITKQEAKILHLYWLNTVGTSLD